jgi:putative transposase
MARLARVIAVGVPHHVTQHGDARRFIQQDESGRKVYLDLLRQSTEFHGIAVVGYCLMTNHVHLIAISGKGDVLARALKETHGRFASYWNAPHHSTGHVWQGRYYSCPLDKRCRVSRFSCLKFGVHTNRSGILPGNIGAHEGQ